MSKQNKAKIKDRAAAFEACREMIHGDGTDASVQRVIDLARIALGLERRGYKAGPKATLPTN